MASSVSTEVKVLKRGPFYMTPVTEDHLDEVVENLSSENKREIKLLGYADLKMALRDMYEQSEAYVVRKDDGPILCIGGLWFVEDQDFPQMFTIFTEHAKKNFVGLIRGSRLLVQYFQQSHPHITMTIHSDYEGILNWAAWLGFEPVGVMNAGYDKYVEFIRCNLGGNCVYDKAPRPVIH